MQKEKQFTLKANDKEYTFTTGEYMGTKTPKVMIRGELRGDDKAALFLLAIDPMWASIRASSSSQEDSIKEIYKAALVAVEEYIKKNEWAHGGTYYGEMTQNGSFDITGTEKPYWEDGNWGSKL